LVETSKLRALRGESEATCQGPQISPAFKAI
jgi:hypothetical protein